MEKRRSNKPDTFTASQVGTLIEDLRSQFRIFGERMDTFESKLKCVATNQAHTLERITRLELKMNKRFNEVDKRFGEVNDRFNEVDKRFGEVNDRFNEVDRRFNEVDKRFGEVNIRFDKLDSRVAHLETSLA